MAAKSKKTPDVMAALCERLASGRSLRSICEDKEMPARQTVLQWLAADEVFAAQYARAREEQADHYADEIVTIADEPPEVVQDEKGGVTVVLLDGAAIARQRLRIDARKWVASKLRPKKYGDRQEIEHSGNVTLTPNVNLIIDQMAGGALRVETDPVAVDGAIALDKRD
jgi:hypothetical protein